MTVKTVLQDIFSKLNFSFQHYFWDIAKHGKTPDTYCVWRERQRGSISSDGEYETVQHELQISVFTKNDDVAELVEQISAAAKPYGATCSLLEFEDYEKDTGYKHGEFTMII